MINGILNGAPIWVWPLLGLLLFIGYKASKPRQVSIIMFYCLPLLGLISVNSVLSLPFQSVAWVCFGIGYVAGAAGAYALQNKWLRGKQSRTISLSGEWFTMLILMIIFWMNFAGGMMKAVSPEIYSTAGFVALYTLLVGAASGSFLGRALKVINYSRN